MVLLSKVSPKHGARAMSVLLKYDNGVKAVASMLDPMPPVAAIRSGGGEGGGRGEGRGVCRYGP